MPGEVGWNNSANGMTRSMISLPTPNSAQHPVTSDTNSYPHHPVASDTSSPMSSSVHDSLITKNSTVQSFVSNISLTSLHGESRLSGSSNPAPTPNLDPDQTPTPTLTPNPTPTKPSTSKPSSIRQKPIPPHRTTPVGTPTGAPPPLPPKQIADTPPPRPASKELKLDDILNMCAEYEKQIEEEQRITLNQRFIHFHSFPFNFIHFPIHFHSRFFIFIHVLPFLLIFINFH